MFQDLPKERMFLDLPEDDFIISYLTAKIKFRKNLEDVIPPNIGRILARAIFNRKSLWESMYVVHVLLPMKSCFINSRKKDHSCHHCSDQGPATKDYSD